MKHGYVLFTWVNDSNGKGYVCHIDQSGGTIRIEQLSEDDNKRCVDVNEIVGTERW